MPRYYLHIRDGAKMIEDLEGVELPGIVSAKEEAEKAAREILAEKVRSGDVVDGQEFDIVDAWGNRLLTLPFKQC